MTPWITISYVHYYFVSLFLCEISLFGVLCCTLTHLTVTTETDSFHFELHPLTGRFTPYHFTSYITAANHFFSCDSSKKIRRKKHESKFEWKFINRGGKCGECRSCWQCWTINRSITIGDHNNAIYSFIITGHITTITVFGYVNRWQKWKTQNYFGQSAKYILFRPNDSWNNFIELQTKEENPG